MDLQSTDWPVFEQHLFSTRTRQILQFPHPITCFLLDLQQLEEKALLTTGENALSTSLSRRELARLKTFSLAKRKREWFGGRLAAKYAVKRLLALTEPLPDTSAMADYAILADENGRPFISADAQNMVQPVPDISISHSGSFAAALAVHRGYGGIDLQKITPKVLKVKNRFCTPGEERILLDSYSAAPESITGVLTKLWAAKEALRKMIRLPVLPGFLEMQLVEIIGQGRREEAFPRCFVINIKPSASSAGQTCRVAVTGLKDYALAVSLRSATVD